jgi:hypothetical protein
MTHHQKLELHRSIHRNPLPNNPGTSNLVYYTAPSALPQFLINKETHIRTSQPSRLIISPGRSQTWSTLLNKQNLLPRFRQTVSSDETSRSTSDNDIIVRSGLQSISLFSEDPKLNGYREMKLTAVVTVGVGTAVVVAVGVGPGPPPVSPAAQVSYSSDETCASLQSTPKNPTIQRSLFVRNLATKNFDTSTRCTHSLCVG